MEFWNVAVCRWSETFADSPDFVVVIHDVKFAWSSRSCDTDIDVKNIQKIIDRADIIGRSQSTKITEILDVVNVRQLSTPVPSVPEARCEFACNSVSNHSWSTMICSTFCVLMNYFLSDNWCFQFEALEKLYLKLHYRYGNTEYYTVHVTNEV